MKTQLSRPEEIQIMSHEDAKKMFQLLIMKIHEIEEQKPKRDQGLVEELFHLRKETRDGFENINQRFNSLEDKMGKNTLAIKSLERVMNEKLTATNEKLNSLEGVMQGGFDNVGKILQEISNKLDR